MKSSPSLPPLPALPAGVKRVTKRKPDGSSAHYYYLRSNGARVPAPDAPGFEKARKDAEARQGREAEEGPLAQLVAAYRRSPEYQRLTHGTKLNKERGFIWIDHFQNLQLSQIKRSHVLDLRDLVAAQCGPGTATIVVSCISALFSWALQRGKAEVNPAFGVKKLPIGAWQPWTEDEAATALDKLPLHLRRVTQLALHTAQRRSDLIAMTWAQYDGRCIAVKQQKTGKRLMVPLLPGFRAELEQWKAEGKSAFILTTAAGTPWTNDTITNALWRHLPALGIHDRSLHGLRKLALVRLAEAGASTHEIAAIAGHASLAMVAHYTKGVDQLKLAEAAISKLETANGNRRENTA